MNGDMDGRFQPVFQAGDFVQERDTEVCGHVRGPGCYPGEWRIVCADGSETACLGEHLYCAPVARAPRSSAPPRFPRA